LIQAIVSGACWLAVVMPVDFSEQLGAGGPVAV